MVVGIGAEGQETGCLENVVLFYLCPFPLGSSLDISPHALSFS